jgi:hypothetical protein
MLVPYPRANIPLRPRFPPGGVAGRAVHELSGIAKNGGLVGFAVLLLADLPAGETFWIGRVVDVYAPGLAWLGLDPRRLVVVQAADDAACLGALETVLRGGMNGVAEVQKLSRLAARRLALAARHGGGTGLVLRSGAASDSTAVASRWEIAVAPSGPEGAPRWRAQLLYARGGRPENFLVEADLNETPPALRLVAGMADHTAGQTTYRATG